MFISVLSRMILLCGLMGVGFFAKKYNIISENASNDISNLIVKITLPCLLVVSMQRTFSKDVLSELVLTFVISFIIMILSYFIGKFIVKFINLNDKEKQIFVFTITFTNMTFMGFPVIEGIYGYDGLFYASIASMSFNFLVFTLGIKIVNNNSKENLTIKSFINNAIIACFFGLLFFILPIDIPEMIFDFLETIGNITTPLSMIVIGILLTESNFKTLFSDYRIYILAGIRLIIMPIIIYIILNSFIDNKMMIGCISILFGMPGASTMVILAQQYGSDEVFASKVVFVTIIMSLITIPILAVML